MGDISSVIRKFNRFELVTAYNQEHNLVDQAAHDAAVQDVLDFVAQRYEFLQTTELLSQ
jgi:hypothetical protein